MVLCSLTCFCQEQIHSDELKEDFRILGDIAMEISPKLNAEDRVAIDKIIDRNLDLLEDTSMTTAQFLNFIAELGLHTQFDEHASIGLGNATLEPLLEHSRLFPLPVCFIKKALVVNTNVGALPLGSELHQINETPIKQVLKKMASDSGNLFIQQRLAEQFSMVYLLRLGSCDTFYVHYSLPENPDVVRQIKLPGVEFKTLVKSNEERRLPLNREALNHLTDTHYFEDENAFYLQLNSFSWVRGTNHNPLNLISANHTKLKRHFNRIFRTVRKTGANHLILDLRFNTGGNVLGPAILYHFLATSSFEETVRLTIPDFDFPHTEYITAVSGKEVKSTEQVERYTSIWAKRFASTDSNYQWMLKNNYEWQPHKRAFKGKVTLLVSGQSVSASAYFAALFRAYRRGQIIGEGVGGSHHSITAGKEFVYQLPHSKLLIIVPIMIVDFDDYLYERVPQNHVEPDLQCSHQEWLNGLIEGKDSELRKALNYDK